jgi:hypothetical protein
MIRPTLALLLALTTAAHAQVAPEITRPATPNPQHLLWVGNSFFYYNNGMQSLVGHLAAGSPDHPAYASTLVAIGGSGFDWHEMESLLRPNAVGSYNFDPGNNIIPTTRTKLWDAVIMMDCSQCPIHPTLSRVFTEYARKNSEIVRARGAEPIFFMSWAYADKPEMTAKLAEAYTAAANANHALVIPAGLAFARAHEARPALVLYQPDNRHPTMAGSYLAASTVYATLYGRSPEPNAFNAGLDPETANFLRTTAWDTVQAYMAGSVTH